MCRFPPAWKRSRKHRLPRGTTRFAEAFSRWRRQSAAFLWEKAPFVRRASPCMDLGKLSFCGFRRSFEQRGYPQCRPLCVVAIIFDGTHRLPSRRFRRESKVICFGPCCRGFEFGVTARRCGNFFWVILLNLPIGMSSIQSIWVTAHGFLYKADVFDLHRWIS